MIFFAFLVFGSLKFGRKYDNYTETHCSKYYNQANTMLLFVNNLSSNYK